MGGFQTRLGDQETRNTSTAYVEHEGLGLAQELDRQSLEKKEATGLDKATQLRDLLGAVTLLLSSQEDNKQALECLRRMSSLFAGGYQITTCVALHQRCGNSNFKLLCTILGSQTDWSASKLEPWFLESHNELTLKLGYYVHKNPYLRTDFSQIVRQLEGSILENEQEIPSSLGSNVKREAVAGSLFVQGTEDSSPVSRDDILQISAGHCFGMAILAGAAKAYPDKVKELIWEDANYWYIKVKGPDGTMDFSMKKSLLTAEFPMLEDVPAEERRTLAAGSNDHGELYPAVFSKALEKLGGRMDGGSVEDVLEVLGFSYTKYLSLKPKYQFTAEDISAIRLAVDSNQVVVGSGWNTEVSGSHTVTITGYSEDNGVLTWIVRDQAQVARRVASSGKYRSQEPALLPASSGWGFEPDSGPFMHIYVATWK